jgi:hypothetical protein
MKPDTASTQDPHRSLHSEVGPRRGEHPGRARNPVVKVAGLAWLEFEKPDLAQAETFLVGFGFAVVDRTGPPRPCFCVAGGRAQQVWWCAKASARASLGRPSPRTPALISTGSPATAPDRVVTPHRGGHAVELIR